jgi:hypothetical protein
MGAVAASTPGKATAGCSSLPGMAQGCSSPSCELPVALLLAFPICHKDTVLDSYLIQRHSTNYCLSSSK